MDLTAGHAYVIAECKARNDVGRWYEHKDIFFFNTD